MSNSIVCDNKFRNFLEKTKVKKIIKKDKKVVKENKLKRDEEKKEITKDKKEVAENKIKKEEEKKISTRDKTEITENKRKRDEEKKKETKTSNEGYKEKNVVMESIENSKLIEDFELIDYIKTGGTGQVYQAKFKKIQTQKIAALKFLFHKKKSEDHSEILIHKKLKHNNIPDIYGYYKIEGGSCIAMEFSKFGDLENFKKTIIKKTYLSETLLCYFAYQILEAISYLHINKIIHMDIKKQNILVDEFLNVRLTDFSVSLNYKECKDKIVLPRNGTCYYISPEVLNEEEIDVEDASKIDIYSFGVLLYVLAFNDYPYELRGIDSKNYNQIKKNITEKELKFPEKPNTSKMFQNFVKKCLEKDNKKRYNIYEAMRDPWIKGYQFIIDEKERYCNASKLLMNIMVDNIREFNHWIQNE